MQSILVGKFHVDRRGNSQFGYVQPSFQNRNICQAPSKKARPVLEHNVQVKF